MTYLTALSEFLHESLEEVFILTDFPSSASASTRARSLRKLLEQGVLVRLGPGVYCRTRVSSLTGNTIPCKPLDMLALPVLSKLGILAGPSRAVQAYNAGGTQLPMRLAVNVGSRRITRRIGYGGRFIEYEKGNL